ncbi:MAG TPA: lysine--tRNA ligase [Chthonomonadaceae bacterium]|nr:lysine--tRNA ligase [Chthonomonadaceae bacterium]
MPDQSINSERGDLKVSDQEGQRPEELGDQQAQRLQKLLALRAQGRDPFRVERCERTHTAAQITDEASFAQLEGKTVSVAGRLDARRLMGKASFAHLRDESGRVQLYARRDDLGEEAYEQFKDLDLGDILCVRGFVFRTRTGEISIHVQEFTLAAKALRPVPMGKLDEEGRVHSGLTDKEERYRQRYLDLLANPESRRILTQRSKIIRAMRNFLDSRGFLEVETPVLQLVAGGAAARPFLTHHNALDYDFKLRIALELFLKRLIIGGFEKVYEIGRVFRNEGIDTRHNPEFTLMELYQAYANLEDMMELVEEMYLSICEAVNGTPTFAYEGQTIDLSLRPWTRLPILEGIRRYAGIAPEELTSLEAAKAACRRIGVPFDLEKETTLGGLIEKLHEQYTQPHLIQPTFITDFPIETSPLAKKHPDNPSLARRFEVYLATQELGNAFSEINDPLDQRERFEAQAAQLAAGNVEAHPMDEDFLRAMEYGMPPTGGLGVGVDRLAIVLTGAESIRDVILFPLMKPEH